MLITRYLGLLTVCAAATACATVAARPSIPPGVDLIGVEGLRRDLTILAGDAMRGREAGTVDELRAAAWIAGRAREAGLEPAGENGTYFQFFPLRRTRLTEQSAITLRDTPLDLWRDAVVVWPVRVELNAPLLFVGEGREEDLLAVDIRGRAVAAVLSHPDGAPPLGPDLSPRRYALLAVRQRAAFLTARGAAAVVLIADSVADPEYENIAAGWARGGYDLADARRLEGNGDPSGEARPPVIWARRDFLDDVKAGDARLLADLRTESFVVPSANVIARAPGSDPTRAGEHVLFSAHHDGLGVRFPWAGDSIWNGADDNASTSVALLAIAEAFTTYRPARSALFVWHGAEELGLLGSQWLVSHPTVPLESIVAVLNGDMIGMNHPDTAALLGSVPPHRSSTTLVQMALSANELTGDFVVDPSWDDPLHPESFFFRSDHQPYLRAGIPVLFFTTLLHPIYHTPEDEPERIDYAKLTQMARWMYATGWAVAEAPVRPGLDSPAAVR